MEPESRGSADATPLAPPSLRVTMLLADSAQVADRKLYILGGGLTVAHLWRLDLLDEDGHPVSVREQPLVVHGRFEAGRPAGLKPGTPLSVPLAITFPTLPVQPGKSYTWQLAIDGETQVDWRQSFHVRAAAPGQPPLPPPAPGALPPS